VISHKVYEEEGVYSLEDHVRMSPFVRREPEFERLFIGIFGFRESCSLEVSVKDQLSELIESTEDAGTHVLLDFLGSCHPTLTALGKEL
jgi:hypothetical protein